MEITRTSWKLEEWDEEWIRIVEQFHIMDAIFRKYGIEPGHYELEDIPF